MYIIFYSIFQTLILYVGVNAMLRKVACAAASKPSVEIRQNGEQFYIKTSTTVRTTEINFQIGQEFSEETVDGRKCKVITEHWDKPYVSHMIILYKSFWSSDHSNDLTYVSFLEKTLWHIRLYFIMSM